MTRTHREVLSSCFARTVIFFSLSCCRAISTLPGASCGTDCRGAGVVRLVAQRFVQDECLNESHLLFVSVPTDFFEVVKNMRLQAELHQGTRPGVVLLFA